jgi:hypothetical protein
LATGRLDKAVQTALHDEKRGRVRPGHPELSRSRPETT